MITNISFKVSSKSGGRGTITRWRWCGQCAHRPRCMLSFAVGQATENASEPTISVLHIYEARRGYSPSSWARVGTPAMFRHWVDELWDVDAVRCLYDDRVNDMTQSLYVMRCSIGSQCSSRWASLVWSRGQRLATKRTAPFMTRCGGFNVTGGKQANTTLQ